MQQTHTAIHLSAREVTTMSSAQERLAALKSKVQQARNENLKAVEDEGKRQSWSHENELKRTDSDFSDEENGSNAGKRTSQKRRMKERERTRVSDVGSADEADGEDEDDRLRSMKRRAKKLRKSEIVAKDGQGSESQTIAYGVTGHDAKPENIDRMVDELKQVDKRREKYRRRRTFDENRTDITFINEGNRLFNRELDKHFDKFDSVKKIKDSLERGTA